MERDTTLDQTRLLPRNRWLTDDIAYIAPMALFLSLVWVGSHWNGVSPRWTWIYAGCYVARVAAAALALSLLWKRYTPIRWNHWWLGIAVGVVGILQWVPMQLWLQQYAFFRPPKPEEVFNPYRDLPSHWLIGAFITIRLVGAVLVVPVMEELFWRDFLWRNILAPNDFKLARVGEWGWTPFLGVSIAFAVVHGNWWLTSIVWGLMIAGLLLYTKSLGACIIAHATTNLLLGIYVLRWKDWAFW